MRIELLVEGDGDKLAIPSLVGRYFANSHHYVGNSQIVGTAKSLLNRPEKLDSRIKVALAYNPSFIILFSDCDSDCPVTLANELYRIGCETIESQNSDCHFAVCILNPEYEVMFLLSHENIENCAECNIPIDQFEQLRDAKNRFKALIGGSYRETIDQKKYTKFIDFESISQIDSCAHMIRVFEWILNPPSQFYCNEL